MANEKKMTKMEKIDHILTIAEVQADPIAVEYLTHERELLEKKNSGDRKPTKAQLANIDLQKEIAEGMEPNRIYSVTEVIKSNPALSDLSTQKVTYQLRALAKSGVVKAETTSKGTRYSLV